MKTVKMFITSIFQSCCLWRTYPIFQKYIQSVSSLFYRNSLQCQSLSLAGKFLGALINISLGETAQLGCYREKQGYIV